MGDLRLDAADPQSGDAGAPTLRLDRAEMTPPVLTPEGYLVAKAVKLGTIGPQQYVTTNGRKITELRLPEHVFASESLATGEDKPMVLGHPKEGRVDAFNAKGLMVGHMNHLRQDGEFIVGDLVIMDAEAIRAVTEKGVRELSLCYYQRNVPVPGGVFRADGHAFDNTPADVLQTQIFYNHVALERNARANVGRPDRPVSLRLDAAGNQVSVQENSKMKVQIGGKEYDVDDAVGIELVRLQTRAEMMMEGKAPAPAAAPTADSTEVKPAAGAAPAAAPAPAAAVAPADKKEEMRADASKTPIKTEAELKAEKEASQKAEAARFALVQRAVEITKKPVEELLRLDSAEIQLQVIKAIDPQADEADLRTKGLPTIEVAYGYALKSLGEIRVDSAADLSRLVAGAKSQAGPKLDSPFLTASTSYQNKVLGKTEAKP